MDAIDKGTIQLHTLHLLLYTEFYLRFYISSSLKRSYLVFLYADTKISIVDAESYMRYFTLYFLIVKSYNSIATGGTEKAALAIHCAAGFREIGEENGITLLEITREEYLQRPL